MIPAFLAGRPDGAGGPDAPCSPEVQVTGSKLEKRRGDEDAEFEMPTPPF